MTLPQGRRPKDQPAGETPIRSIRVPDVEWAAWQLAAERAGKSVSAWMRDTLNEKARSK